MHQAKLNQSQLEAVDHKNGDLLILAGAGSGKTRVIVHRIASLLEHGVDRGSILALTFTNKAAKEMRERLSSLLNADVAYMWIGTFHSMCLKILRRDIDKLGFGSSFAIYDTYDQMTVMKECMKYLNINEKVFKPSYFLKIISDCKDQLIDVETYKKEYAINFKEKTIARIYEAYQERLYKNNALDFDDIIFFTVKLLQHDPEVKEYYCNKFLHILVDEYQDTNHAQYVLLNLLASKNHNLCVVGDDDQSIYGWRGANIRNILDFEKDRKNVKVVKLEQNYRSTDVILEAAYQVIQKNSERKEKKLWTEKEGGAKIRVNKSFDETKEAQWIATEVSKSVMEEKVPYSNFAVLYRTNAQSRALEEALIKNKIPYKIYGALKFYDRKEIKDIMAYLKILENPLDQVALKRIINVPKRGIGLKTIEKLDEAAFRKDEPLYSVLLSADQLDISTRAKAQLKNFVLMLHSLSSMKSVFSLTELVKKVLENSNYLDELKADPTDEAKTRLENIEEFINVVAAYEDREEAPNLESFLNEVSLISDLDRFESTDNAVSLMTLHSSKGLEFPRVFISGLEDGILPSSRSLLTEHGVEEERRLLYVGITRAQEKLYLSFASERLYMGNRSKQRPSRFLDDISLNLFESSFSNELSKPIRSATSLLQRYQEKYGKKEKSTSSKATEDRSQKGLRPGSKIKHTVFGVGTIVAENNGVYTIAFNDAGIKKIDTHYIKLDVVD